MFIYWAQSIVIGFFSVVSLLTEYGSSLLQSWKYLSGSGHTRFKHRFVLNYQCLLAGFFTLGNGLFHWIFYMSTGSSLFRPGGSSRRT